MNALFFSDKYPASFALESNLFNSYSMASNVLTWPDSLQASFVIDALALRSKYHTIPPPITADRTLKNSMATSVENWLFVSLTPFQRLEECSKKSVAFPQPFAKQKYAYS